MRVVQLGHFVLYTPNLARSIPFYRDVLGLRLTHEVPGGAVFSAGGTHHEFILKDTGDSGGLQNVRFEYHIGFRIGDSLEELRAAKDDLSRLGFTVTGYAQSITTKSIYLRDPDENELELYVDVPLTGAGTGLEMTEEVWPLDL